MESQSFSFTGFVLQNHREILIRFQQRLAHKTSIEVKRALFSEICEYLILISEDARKTGKRWATTAAEGGGELLGIAVAMQAARAVPVVVAVDRQTNAKLFVTDAPRRGRCARY